MQPPCERDGIYTIRSFVRVENIGDLGARRNDSCSSYPFFFIYFSFFFFAFNSRTQLLEENSQARRSDSDGFKHRCKSGRRFISIQVQSSLKIPFFFFSPSLASQRYFRFHFAVWKWISVSFVFAKRIILRNFDRIFVIAILFRLFTFDYWSGERAKARTAARATTQW